MRAHLIYSFGLISSLSWIADIAFAADRTLNVVGWNAIHNLYRSDRPDDALGNDPIVGRQACPSLVRYNGTNMKPEAVLLKSLPDEGQSGGRWLFSLRPNIRWWSGAAVSQSDVTAYLEKELKDVLSDRHLEGSPKIGIQGATVEVQWAKPPGFGPMILAGRPFWRAVTGKTPGFECAGLYTISTMDPNTGLTMQLSKGYSARFQTIRLTQSQAAAKDKSGSSLQFTSDTAISPASTTIPSRKCEALLDIPFVTALIWNPESRWVSTPGVRQALTQAIPRGEILRTAAADLGTLISGPLLRNHPGYAVQQAVPPFSLEIAGNLLASAGFKQPAIGSPRLAADGSVMHLKILRAGKTRPSLIEKIISDTYASLGIEMEFLESSENISQADGVLAGVALPWPELDLREFLHSRPQKKLSSFPFFLPNDKSLDEALDAYDQSLINGKPRLDLLMRVHARFADLESWSMIIGHQACVKTNGFMLKGKLNIADPDWFRRLVIE